MHRAGNMAELAAMTPRQHRQQCHRHRRKAAVLLVVMAVLAERCDGEVTFHVTGLTAAGEHEQQHAQQQEEQEQQPQLLDPFERAKLFNSPACRDFYGRSGERGANMEVWESATHPKYPPGYSTDAVYCPPQGIVYVDNVKAGSTTVRDTLRNQFGCSWSTHFRWPPEEMEVRQRFCSERRLTKAECNEVRSRTDWLVESVTSNAFFFSVTREPLNRFISGYKQAVTTGGMHVRGWNVSQYLEAYRENVVNEHTETQARRLSGRDARGRQVPMHFIASLDNLEHDLELLWAHLGLPPLPAQAHKHQNASNGDEKKESLNATLTVEQIRELCGHLAQDFVCFGYALPPECR